MVAFQQWSPLEAFGNKCDFGHHNDQRHAVDIRKEEARHACLCAVQKNRLAQTALMGPLSVTASTHFPKQ